MSYLKGKNEKQISAWFSLYVNSFWVIWPQSQFNKNGLQSTRLKSSYDGVIATINDFSDQWAPSTAAPMEKLCEPQEGLGWKINLIWSHSMWISWSAYELFSQPSYTVCIHLNHPKQGMT